MKAAPSLSNTRLPLHLSCLQNANQGLQQVRSERDAGQLALTPQSSTCTRSPSLRFSRPHTEMEQQTSAPAAASPTLPQQHPLALPQLPRSPQCSHLVRQRLDEGGERGRCDLRKQWARSSGNGSGHRSGRTAVGWHLREWKGEWVHAGSDLAASPLIWCARMSAAPLQGVRAVMGAALPPSHARHPACPPLIAACVLPDGHTHPMLTAGHASRTDRIKGTCMRNI